VPFVALVSLLLVGGVAGLLAFNTSMQQSSFTASALGEKAGVLSAEEQSLSMQLARLRDPQRLALRANAMGMVPPPSPAFIQLSDGRVLGKPAAAVAGTSLQVTPLQKKRPMYLRRHTVKVFVDPSSKSAADGAPSSDAPSVTGTKKPQAAVSATGGSTR